MGAVAEEELQRPSPCGILARPARGSSKVGCVDHDLRVVGDCHRNNSSNEEPVEDKWNRQSNAPFTLWSSLEDCNRLAKGQVVE